MLPMLEPYARERKTSSRKRACSSYGANLPARVVKKGTAPVYQTGAVGAECTGWASVRGYLNSRTKLGTIVLKHSVFKNSVFKHSVLRYSVLISILGCTAKAHRDTAGTRSSRPPPSSVDATR